MKKLITLCLALAMVVSVGAYALTALCGNNIAASAEETASQTENELTVKAKEAYAYSTETPDTHIALTENPGSNTMKTLKASLGMSLFTDALKSNYKIYFKLETAVDASEYYAMTFKALYWANGAKYLSTGISGIDGSSSSSVEIYGIQSKSVSADILWVKVPVEAVKNADGKVEGFILTAPEFTSAMSMSWFMISDFTFTKTFTQNVPIDYTDSEIRQDWFPSSIDLWKNEKMRNAFYDISGTFRKTIKFVSPVSVNDVDYFDFKALIWGGGAWLPFNVYPIGGETANQNALVFNESSTSDWSKYDGKLDMRVAAKGLENENGLIEGFDIEITGIPANSHLVFSDIAKVTEVLPLAVVDERRTTVTGGLNEGFQTTNWANVESWTKNGVLYGGRNNDTKYGIVLKYPVDSAKVKTIDFKAILWRDTAVRPVLISKLDGTPVEIINVQGGWEDVFENDINVSVNAELLAEENGLVYGFKMEEVSEPSVAFQFSKFTSGAEAKTYTVTYKADGSEDIVKTFTAATKAIFETPAVPAKEHYTGAWDKEIAFTEGQVINAVYTAIEYTATFKVGEQTVGTVKYTTENKDSITVPEVPAKEHYTGAWENYALDYDNAQVINAVYTANTYTITFKADGKVVETKNYTVENKDGITAPEVPAKEHYTGAWENYTLDYDNAQIINAVYTAIEYTATFKAGEQTVGTVKYTVENKDSITVPEVPAKEHYTGIWENYALDYDNAQVINAVYTANTYTITFKADGETVATVNYTFETKDDVTAPEVPEKAHYTGEWNEYALDYTATQEVTAKYTAITYTITFKADGEVVGTVNYTEETKNSVTAPEVPEKSGYTGKWAEFEPSFDNAQVVEAVYTEIPDDGGCTASMSGCGMAIAGIGMAVVALKKKRG